MTWSLLFCASYLLVGVVAEHVPDACGVVGPEGDDRLSMLQTRAFPGSALPAAGGVREMQEGDVQSGSWPQDVVTEVAEQMPPLPEGWAALPEGWAAPRGLDRHGPLPEVAEQMPGAAEGLSFAEVSHGADQPMRPNANIIGSGQAHDVHLSGSHYPNTKPAPAPTPGGQDSGGAEPKTWWSRLGLSALGLLSREPKHNEASQRVEAQQQMPGAEHEETERSDGRERTRGEQKNVAERGKQKQQMSEWMGLMEQRKAHQSSQIGAEAKKNKQQDWAGQFRQAERDWAGQSKELQPPSAEGDADLGRRVEVLLQEQQQRRQQQMLNLEQGLADLRDRRQAPLEEAKHELYQIERQGYGEPPAQAKQLVALAQLQQPLPPLPASASATAVPSAPLPEAAQLQQPKPPLPASPSRTAEAGALPLVPPLPPSAPTSLELPTDEDCVPRCRWECNDPRCAQQCRPVCKAPKCETRCGTPDVSACSMDCSKPHCMVVCPKALCPKVACAHCSTTCSDPVCKLNCPKSQPCRNVCQEPECEWDCRRPTDCPLPQCSMVCEHPKNCFATTHTVLPDLLPGEVSVGGFSAETGTATLTQMHPDGETSSRIETLGKNPGV